MTEAMVWATRLLALGNASATITTGTGSAVLPPPRPGIYGNDAAEARGIPSGRVDVNGKDPRIPASTITRSAFAPGQLRAVNCVLVVTNVRRQVQS